MLRIRILTTALFASLALGVVVPAAASAQSPAPVVIAQASKPSGGGTGAEKAGKELGKILNSWTLSLAFAIAGVMALVALGRRNFGEMAVIAGITFVGSMFFLDEGSPARNLFQSILNQIT